MLFAIDSVASRIEKSLETTMNKTELVSHISRTTKVPKATVNLILSTLLRIIVEHLKERGRITLMGFGSFHIVQRAARTGRNPKTGQVINIPETVTPAFKAGKAFKESVQNPGRI